jgi:hypothetical protein
LRAILKNYLPAIACALTPILCYLLARPYAEIGIYDDWSFVKTAQVFAQTGHIAYNGWASPMLGWQACLGALFVKLFGFSFSAVRFATVIEATATAFLMQRIFMRAGMNSSNATLATLIFILSPLYLPLAFTFMTDVSGVLCIMACLYMCLRAVQAAREDSAIAWICSAALLNALDGTARQIAWLGVLVIVPSTVWLLRRSRRVLVAGSLSCIAGTTFVVAAMYWFAQQPHAEPFSPISDRIGWESLKNVARACLLGGEQLIFLASPVLLMYTRCLHSRNRQMMVLCATVVLCFALMGFTLIHPGVLKWWVSPVEDSMTDNTFGKLNAMAVQETGLPTAAYGLRFLMTGATILGILSFATCSLERAHERLFPERKWDSLSWKELGIMIGPFSLAYITLLASIAAHREMFNRYLLPLLAVLLLMLMRYCQEAMKTHLPLASVILTVVLGGFSIAATHDGFALYRGYRSAIDVLRSGGIPATAIFEPWEFVGWTEIDQVGYINYPETQTAQAGSEPRLAPALPASCDDWSARFLTSASAIHPVYAISVNPTECGGRVAFPLIAYRTWVAPHINSIYAVRLPASLPH